MDNILEVTGLVKRYPSFSLDNISLFLPICILTSCCLADISLALS